MEKYEQIRRESIRKRLLLHIAEILREQGLISVRERDIIKRMVISGEYSLWNG